MRLFAAGADFGYCIYDGKSVFDGMRKILLKI